MGPPRWYEDVWEKDVWEKRRLGKNLRRLGKTFFPKRPLLGPFTDGRNAIPDTRAWFASRSEAEATETHSDTCWRDIRREAEQRGADRDPNRGAALKLSSESFRRHFCRRNVQRKFVDEMTVCIHLGKRHLV